VQGSSLNSVAVIDLEAGRSDPGFSIGSIPTYRLTVICVTDLCKDSLIPSDVRHTTRCQSAVKLLTSISGPERVVPHFPLEVQVPYSIREAVLVQGVLRGMDLEAQCVVRAIKVSLPKLDVWEYVKADITNAPTELPLGAYELSYEGRKMRVNKTARGWISGQA